MHDLPVYLFHQGTNYCAYEFLGSHFGMFENKKGVFFRVFAPRAESVSVVGDFNNWNENDLIMKRISKQGIWEAFSGHVSDFDNYKYAIKSNGKTRLKSDPFARCFEIPPNMASKVFLPRSYRWRDERFCLDRSKKSPYKSAINAYEVSLTSWKRHEDGSFYTYLELADELVPYVRDMGFTHVEFMPVCEYPFEGSWGYQVTGYFSVTSRLGCLNDFMYLVDEFHLNGIGVILDWVPAHFPKDEHGLYEFDGSPLYEDSRKTRMEHKGWGTRIFDFGRNEVQSFLISSAMFFFDKCHIDGLRVDAVASMLYLDYDRCEGEWERNSLGTNINLEAVAFLKKLNAAVYDKFPYALMIAEESTAFPMVTKPVSAGGLGFGFKWNMGWMNDILSYMKTNPFFRKGVHNNLTFTMTYAFSENYVLAISHDEVVHGKGSLVEKMPTEYEDKFSNVKAFYGFMMSHVGKKLMFMGQEFGQFKEWNYQEGLEFFLLEYPIHQKLQTFFKDVNRFYSSHEQFYSIEDSWDGFKWLVCDDAENNVIAYLRRGFSDIDILVIVNFSGVDRNYSINVGDNKSYELVFNSDDSKYGGRGMYRKKRFAAKKSLKKRKGFIITVNIAKYSFMYLESNIHAGVKTNTDIK